MNAQPRSLTSVQADQMLAELEAATQLNLDDLPTHAADLEDLPIGSTTSTTHDGPTDRPTGGRPPGP